MALTAEMAYPSSMAKKGEKPSVIPASAAPRAGKPSSLLDTRVIYCGDNPEQLAKPALSLPNGLPDACVDLIYIDPPFNSNRNYEVFWGETKVPILCENNHPSLY